MNITRLSEFGGSDRSQPADHNDRLNCNALNYRKCFIKAEQKSQDGTARRQEKLNVIVEACFEPCCPGSLFKRRFTVEQHILTGCEQSANRRLCTDSYPIANSPSRKVRWRCSSLCVVVEAIAGAILAICVSQFCDLNCLDKR